MAPKKKQKMLTETSRQKAQKRFDPTDCRHYGFELVDEYQKKRWERLKNREVVATRYFYNSHAVGMGIDDNIWFLLDRVGMTKFMKERWPTYVNYTLEFLSTLVVSTISRSNKTPTHITFRLNNEERRMSLEALNAIYDFPTNANPKTHEEFSEIEFHVQLTEAPGLVQGLTHNPQRNKASAVRNPVFRFIQKMLAHTVLARPETGTLRTEELYLLWCMVRSHQANVGAILIDQFQSIVMKQKRSIAIGGLITPILKAFDIGLNDLEPLPAPKEFEVAELESLRMVKWIRSKKSGGYLVIQNEGPYLVLPNPELTWVEGPMPTQNWTLASEEHIAASRMPDDKGGDHLRKTTQFAAGTSGGAHEEEANEEEAHEDVIGEEDGYDEGYDEGYTGPTVTHQQFQEYQDAQRRVYDSMLDLMSRRLNAQDRRFEEFAKQQREYMERHDQQVSNFMADYRGRMANQEESSRAFYNEVRAYMRQMREDQSKLMEDNAKLINRLNIYDPFGPPPPQ